MFPRRINQKSQFKQSLLYSQKSSQEKSFKNSSKTVIPQPQKPKKPEPTLLKQNSRQFYQRRSPNHGQQKWKNDQRSQFYRPSWNRHQHRQWNQPQSSTRFPHQKFSPQATHGVRNYFLGFRRQQVQQCRNYCNPFQSFHSRHHKKNQNKNFVMK